MSNLTSLEITMKAEDAALLRATYEVPGALRADPFDDEHEVEFYPGVVCLSAGQVSPLDDMAFVVAAGRPFFGMHGSHAGDYPAYRVAFDGEEFDEHPCDEEGQLSIAGLLNSDPDAGLPCEPLAAWDFIRHYKKCKELVIGKGAE